MTELLKAETISGNSQPANHSYIRDLMTDVDQLGVVPCEAASALDADLHE